MGLVAGPPRAIPGAQCVFRQSLLEIIGVFAELPVRDGELEAPPLVALDRDECLQELLAESRAHERIGLERVERLTERERHCFPLDRRLVHAVGGRARVEPALDPVDAREDVNR
jgi:hypothetical protein